ncbi:rhodanese-like domain-containing protein [Agrococcus jenensis]|uniref:Rhodanese-related sulfurtransferase n=1 Tax=Agrococcus jenensis TaxID=46353 RepID=A0A3N2AWK6_9MICO|nr:rhodanese-like domain-containing protein [Agrococcus jenensis]ROR67394.1 rhodanese-related sulfurtransferase [Agrococcus jenensis]
MREIQPAEVGTMPIVDVRGQQEWDAGHAVGAIHIPMSEVVARLDEVPDGAAVICRSGARSGQVVAYLEQQGRDAANVAGGTLQWAAEGRPMVGAVL